MNTCYFICGKDEPGAAAAGKAFVVKKEAEEALWERALKEIENWALEEYWLYEDEDDVFAAKKEDGYRYYNIRPENMIIEDGRFIGTMFKGKDSTSCAFEGGAAFIPGTYGGTEGLSVLPVQDSCVYQIIPDTFQSWSRVKTLVHVTDPSMEKLVLQPGTEAIDWEIKNVDNIKEITICEAFSEHPVNLDNFKSLELIRVPKGVPQIERSNYYSKHDTVVIGVEGATVVIGFNPQHILYLGRGGEWLRQ